ncbi:MAG: ATP-binding protein [bacterium]|uniref:histidine kinase n=2 Tax=Bacteria candidate phyla TaxID=1783234 RepID=A0A117M798_UNCT6|nr:MAG: Multi-sensor signal transduction histidine kinase [candidate division TA06 bacterium 32_111]KUK88237.1 MAG: Multi-sensor signal transduction histidine kinase [candidate division TA06 bacterium 34_109]MDI6701039.1 ATP-binding protein [bacterium]HAF07170.1 hypothetical protein [candidate division WOR-3 bacterium]HCP16021.1 hypothetical protein [candidate division WOR-3 bacterium]
MIFEQESDPKNLLPKIENLPLVSPFDLTYILAALNRIIKAQTSGIFINIENRLVYVATYGKNDHLLLFQSLLEEESVEGYIFKNNDVLIPKSLEFEYFKPNSSSATSVMPITIVGTPITSVNKTIGGIIAFNREKNTLFTSDDLKILKSISLKIGEFVEQNRNKFQLFEKKLFLINKTIIESFPFPFLLTNTTGKVENFSEKTKSVLKRVDILGKDIFEVIKITKNNGEEVDLKAVLEEVATKTTERILKNVRINNNFEEIYNLTIKYINPDRMIHNILFYFINTEDINEEKQKIVTNLSHELRTPMTAILGSVQILLSDFDGTELTPTQKEFLTILKNETERFSTIFSTILDYKESSDLLGLKEEEIDLSKLLIEVGNVFTMKILKKDIFFKLSNFDSELFIRADSNAIKHIFHQLIDNAIKFSPEGGKVEIIYEGTKLVENKWKKIISIEDEGPGIPNEIKSEIFEPFQRDDEKVHSKIGTGLGLTIVKEILDTVGGYIEIKDREPKGTKVTILL